MKLTVVGDVHAKPDNLEKVNILFDIIEDLGNPCVLLGDLLDTKELVRGKCLNTYIKRMAESKLDFYVICGNHDYFNLECKEHSLTPLKLLNNVKVIDEPFKAFNCYFAPFSADEKQLMDWMSNEFKHDLPLFGHFDTVGFDYGNGYVSDHGLTEADFKRFPVVISGHYHKYQQKLNITYLGTPFSHSFGESNQEKFIGVFDTKTHHLELIPTPFPRHVTVEVTPEKSSINLDPENFNRVIIEGPADFVKAYPREAFVKYVERVTTEDSKSKEIVNEVQSPEVQFQKWAAEIKGLDNDTISLGLELLRCF